MTAESLTKKIDKVAADVKATGTDVTTIRTSNEWVEVFYEFITDETEVHLVRKVRNRAPRAHYWLYVERVATWDAYDASRAISQFVGVYGTACSAEGYAEAKEDET